MRSVQLPHTLTVRVSPEFRDELAAAAKRESVTSGEFVRQAVRAELDSVSGRALDPYAAIPLAELQEHLTAAIRAIGDEEAVQDLVAQIGEDVTDGIEALTRIFVVLNDETVGQRFEATAGYLRQASECLLRAASRTKAFRVQRAIASGELERIEARLGGEAA